MYRYIGNRLVGAIVTIWVVITLVFVLARMTGDPVKLFADPYATQQDIKGLRQRMGLDAPIPKQYAIYLGDIVHGNFGRSLRFRKSALDMYSARLPATLKLLVVAALVSIGIGVPIGTLSGVSPNGLFDRTAK